MVTSPTAQPITADMVADLTRQYPESEQRIWRGAELVPAGHVERAAHGPAGLFLVRSAENPNSAYTVDAYGCSCWDFQKRGGFCKHRAARALYIASERAECDAEQAAPRIYRYRCADCGHEYQGTKDEWPCPLCGGWGDVIHGERADAEQDDPDAYYCVLCEEPIPAAEVVETRWGFMHERCAASEPPTDAAPPQCPRCYAEDAILTHVDWLGARCLSAELFGEGV